jgi:hypothetical protein
VVPLPKEVLWEAWEAKETMLMSMSSLETPPHTAVERLINEAAV